MNLSILIITFNSEKYIEGCLESIYNSLSKIQNYNDIMFVYDKNKASHSLKRGGITYDE